MNKENIVFLTGGSAGLGKATAELLMQNGYTVYSASRRLAESKEDPSSQGKIIPLQMDVTDIPSITAAVSAIMEKEGRIDILICNAGNGIAGAIEETSPEEAKFQFETNFFGTVNVIHEVLPIMRKQKSGKIITTSSVAGFIPIPYQGFYSASKAAVKIYSQTLSIEMKQFNVQCCPATRRRNSPKAGGSPKLPNRPTRPTRKRGKRRSASWRTTNRTECVP